MTIEEFVSEIQDKIIENNGTIILSTWVGTFMGRCVEVNRIGIGSKKKMIVYDYPINFSEKSKSTQVEFYHVVLYENNKVINELFDLTHEHLRETEVIFDGEKYNLMVKGVNVCQIKIEQRKME